MRKLAGLLFLSLAWQWAFLSPANCESIKIVDGWVKLGNAWDYTVHQTLNENKTTDTWRARTDKFDKKSSILGYDYLEYSSYQPGEIYPYAINRLSQGSSYLRMIGSSDFYYGKSITNSKEPLEVFPISVSTTDKNKFMGDGYMLVTNGSYSWTENSEAYVTYVGKEALNLPIGNFDCTVIFVLQQWLWPSSSNQWYGSIGIQYWVHPQYGIIKKKQNEWWMNGDTGQAYSNDETCTLTRMNLAPDLTPYTPSGWPAPLIFSNTTGTRTQDGIKVGQTTYIDMSFANDSSFTIPTSIPVKCTVYDGDTSVAQKETSGFTLDTVISWNDIPAVIEGTGTHNFRLVIDPVNGVAESNESNNAYSLSVTAPEVADLNVESISISPTKPKDNEDIAVGFVARNWGLAESAQCTYTVSVDGTPKYSAFMPILASRGGQHSQSGIAIGQLGIGNHQITVAVDSAAVVEETDEQNNSMQKIIGVSHSQTASRNWELYQ